MKTFFSNASLFGFLLLSCLQTCLGDSRVFVGIVDATPESPYEVIVERLDDSLRATTETTVLNEVAEHRYELRISSAYRVTVCGSVLQQSKIPGERRCQSQIALPVDHGETLLFHLESERFGQLPVRVLAQDLSPVAEAEISVYRGLSVDRNKPSGPLVGRGRTDIRGRVEFQVPQRFRGVVFVSHKDYAPSLETAVSIRHLGHEVGVIVAQALETTIRFADAPEPFFQILGFSSYFQVIETELQSAVLRLDARGGLGWWADSSGEVVGHPFELDARGDNEIRPRYTCIRGHVRGSNARMIGLEYLGDVFAGQYAEVGDDGQFELREMVAGQYLVVLKGLPACSTVISAGGRGSCEEIEVRLPSRGTSEVPECKPILPKKI